MGNVKPLKKVAKKFVTISNSESIEKKPKSKYKKWQLWISKKIGVTPADNYQYLFRVSYKGTHRLKVNDIVVNQSGQLFAVLRESNRFAMIVSHEGHSEKPLMHGKLVIVPRKEKN